MHEDTPRPDTFSAWRQRQAQPAAPIRRGKPELEYDRATVVKMYFTYSDTAALCFRSVDHIKHLVLTHKLARVLVEVERNTKGRKGRPRRIALLPAETVNELRRLTLGL